MASAALKSDVRYGVHGLATATYAALGAVFLGPVGLVLGGAVGWIVGWFYSFGGAGLLDWVERYGRARRVRDAKTRARRRGQRAKK